MSTALWGIAIIALVGSLAAAGAALAVGIALVLFTIGTLDRPFGTESRVGPDPLELVLREIGEGSGR